MSAVYSWTSSHDSRHPSCSIFFLALHLFIVYNGGCGEWHKHVMPSVWWSNNHGALILIVLNKKTQSQILGGEKQCSQPLERLYQILSKRPLPNPPTERSNPVLCCLFRLHPQPDCILRLTASHWAPISFGLNILLCPATWLPRFHLPGARTKGVAQHSLALFLFDTGSIWCSPGWALNSQRSI